ncbi:unnamed protein product, partial [Ceratitis capitata]
HVKSSGSSRISISATPASHRWTIKMGSGPTGRSGQTRSRTCDDGIMQQMPC